MAKRPVGRIAVPGTMTQLYK